MRSLFLLFVLFALQATAQNAAPFIQVTVTDTAVAPTARIVYSCSVRQAYMTGLDDYMVLNAGSSKEQKKLQEKLKQQRDSACIDQNGLNVLLTAMGYRLLADPEMAREKYSVNPMDPSACSDAAFVELTSEAQLMELIELIRSKGNVHGKVVSWEHDTRSHDKLAMARMYAAAHEQAQDLATVSGQKLGPMIHAEEAEGMGSVFPYQKEYLLELLGNTQEHRTMTFRFALLP